VEVQKKTEPVNNSYLAYILGKIALTYKSMNKKEESLNFYQEALQVQRKTKPLNYSSLARLLDNTAFAYKSMNMKKKSLQCYQEALQIRRDRVIQ
jgi:tetratricopeptide (TPR) repeat protein